MKNLAILLFGLLLMMPFAASVRAQNICVSGKFLDKLNSDFNTFSTAINAISNISVHNKDEAVPAENNLTDFIVKIIPMRQTYEDLTPPPGCDGYQRATIKLFANAEDAAAINLMLVTHLDRVDYYQALSSKQADRFNNAIRDASAQAALQQAEINALQQTTTVTAEPTVTSTCQASDTSQYQSDYADIGGQIEKIQKLADNDFVNAKDQVATLAENAIVARQKYEDALIECGDAPQAFSKMFNNLNDTADIMLIQVASIDRYVKYASLLQNQNNRRSKIADDVQALLNPSEATTSLTPTKPSKIRITFTPGGKVPTRITVTKQSAPTLMSTVPPKPTVKAATAIPAGSTCPNVHATCGQLTCAQAYACLAAGNKSLDSDGDGKPCETTCGG